MEVKFMKKTGVVLGLLACTILFSGAKANAQTYEEKGLKYEVHKKQAVIIGGEISGDVLEIPATIGGFPVTRISSYPFWERKDKGTCKSICLPDSITEIGGSAFSGFKDLKSVKMPKNLKTIKYNAFWGCTNLTDVKFNVGLKRIDTSAFQDCIKLNSVSLPSTVKEIGSYAFSNCYKLGRLSLGKHLQNIGYMAFYKNYALKSVEIPSEVKMVDSRAFSKCDKLVKVKFKNSKTKLGEGVFRKCAGLKNATLPGHLTTIPEATFEKCKKLQTYRLGKKVAIIKKNAFHGCTSLKKVQLNNTVYAIGDRAFADSGLTSIKLNDKMQFIGNGAFSDTGIKKIALKNKVTYIGNRVFADCSKLKKIIIPASVKGINPGAFNNCVSLRTIQVAKDNPMYSSQDGVLYDKGKTKLIQYPLHKTNKTFRTPSSLRSIRQKAFAQNNYLKNVTVSADVIGDYAFSNMENLTTVTLTKGKKIGAGAFYYSDSISTLSLPDSVEQIGEYAFYKTAIRKLRIPSRLKKLGISALAECNSLIAFEGGMGRSYRVRDGVLYNGKMTSLIKYPSKKKNKLFVVPNSVKSVKGDAFANARNITKLEFGKGLTSLGYHAVYNANHLKSIVFTSKKFKKGMFSGVSQCDNLAVIVGPTTYQLSYLARSANATLIAL